MSLVRPAAARPGWRVPWAPKPHAAASRSCTCGRQACSTSYRWRTATAASRGAWAQLARLDLLVIDDFAISPIGAAERNDLLELLDDRIGTRSTLITSQLPVKAWHTYLNDPTLADAILDRVVHSSHKIELKATKSLRDTDAQTA